MVYLQIQRHIKAIMLLYAKNVALYKKRISASILLLTVTVAIMAGFYYPFTVNFKFNFKRNDIAILM